MGEILIAIAILGGLGVVFGAVLAAAPRCSMWKRTPGWSS